MELSVLLASSSNSPMMIEDELVQNDGDSQRKKVKEKERFF